FASSLKYVQPQSRFIVRKKFSKCCCTSGCVPSSTYHGPRRQPPNVTRSERSGFPSESFTNQSGCCSKRCDFSSATKGATQIAGSKPRARISLSTPCTLPPNAAPVSSQSPIVG